MSASAPPSTDRAAAFARAVEAKRLASREHCDECVRIAHDLARRGKTLAIEEIFVRKGYLKRPEAQTIARSLTAWGHAAAPAPAPKTAVQPAKPKPSHEPEPKLALAPERAKRRLCPACEKDPGQGSDYCGRCGADLETGAPGPQATACNLCKRVVKKNAAVCPFCATPLPRGHHRRSRAGTDARVWLDRIVLLLVVAACFYFLVYRHAILQPPPGPPPEIEAIPPTPVQTAQKALEAGDMDGAASALEAAMKDPDHDPAIDVPYVIAAKKAGKPAISKAAIKRARAAAPNDPQVLLLAASVALDEGDWDDAQRSLERVPEGSQGDDYFRSRARLAWGKNDASAALAALERVKDRTAAEGRLLAEASLEKGTAALGAGKLETARAAFERAVVLAPAYAPARVQLGTVLLKLEKLGLARQEFERARDLAPLDPAPALGDAIALDRLGAKEDAVKAYRDFLDRAARDEKFAEEAKAAGRRVQALTGG